MADRKTPFLIGIAGPSGAGKTELALHLKRHSRLFEGLGVDNYFKPPETFPLKFGFPNWEVPSDIDFAKLYRDLHDLKRGKTIHPATLPVPTAKGLRRYTLTISPKKYVIVDGFLLFKDRRVRNLLDLKIYIHIPKKFMLERRKMQFGRITEYDIRVAIPEFLRRGLDQIKFSDYVLNGTTPFEQNAELVRLILKSVESTGKVMPQNGIMIDKSSLLREYEEARK